MSYIQADNAVFTVADVLSERECSTLIRETEEVGYQDAPITTVRGFVMAPEIRNNTRVMVDDHAFARSLWARMQAHVPTPRSGCLVGLNERLRYYRYRAGQYFQWHHDGAFHRDARERSTLTLMVYLNDDFEGGHTEFSDYPPVRPERGMAVVFQHGLRHRGAPVTTGTKYVLRTDVMVRWE